MTHLKSPLAWLGGKSRLADRIIDLIPQHTAYCEVFAGAAWVLFKKPESKVEIINDINRELVTLYRCVKHHLPALVEQFRWMLVARDEFDRFLKTPADTLTDIQRSARFYYLAKAAFGARVNKPTFGIAASGAPRLNLLRLEEDLSEAHLRLSRVYIECRPYQDVIDRFDKPGTFFYIDPPYWGCENDYGKELFSREDFTRLAAQLAGVKGKFILSLNDTPGVRDVFGGFNLMQVNTRYSVGASKNQVVGELLITNFEAGR
ncbi:DNA adenine methylase [Rhodoferax sp.]|uniref:DNA adenine methylase n=1 Tax=Rhodoferax sp. TaxID=50421 RepID=UPI0025F5498A|nr:DNA adenine methylase [Rhodoferax sp.]MCM2340455.1 DNA adenine methylase [Rhodoferax sp.]